MNVIEKLVWSQLVEIVGIDSHLDHISIHESTPLLELLDSVAIVKLVMSIEDVIERHTGKFVHIADENIFDPQKSYLRTWKNLRDYLIEVVDEE